MAELEITVLVYVLLIIAFAKMLGEILTRFNQPSIVGELLAGILLGPFVLGYVFTELHDMYTNEFIKQLADLGILLLMLYVGMEFSTKQILASSWVGASIAVSGIVIPLLMGAIVGFSFFTDMKVILFLAVAVSVTALPVTIRILKDMEVIRTQTAMKIISAAIITDVSLLFVLGIILGTEGTSNPVDLAMIIAKYVLFFIVAILISRYLVPQLYKVVRWMRTGEAAFAIAIGMAIAFAAVASLAGLHPFIGAFVAGIILHGAGTGLKVWARVQDILSGVTLGFLAPIFFVLIGFSIDFATVFLDLDNIILFAIILTVSIAGKMLGAYLPSRLSGMKFNESMAIASMMMSKGAMELVFANVALGLGIIDIGLFSILILMAFISTILAPILFKHFFNKAACAGDICKFEKEIEDPIAEPD